MQIKVVFYVSITTWRQNVTTGAVREATYVYDFVLSYWLKQDPHEPGDGVGSGIAGDMNCEDDVWNLRDIMVEHGDGIVGVGDYFNHSGCSGANAGWQGARADPSRGLLPASEKPVAGCSSSQLAGYASIMQDPEFYNLGLPFHSWHNASIIDGRGDFNFNSISHPRLMIGLATRDDSARSPLLTAHLGTGLHCEGFPTFGGYPLTYEKLDISLSKRADGITQEVDPDPENCYTKFGATAIIDAVQFWHSFGDPFIEIREGILWNASIDVTISNVGRCSGGLGGGF